VIKHRALRANLSLIWRISLFLYLLSGSACSSINTPRITTTPEEQEASLSSNFSQSTLSVPPQQETVTFIHQWANEAIDETGTEQALYAVGEPDAKKCDLDPWESVWIYPSAFYDDATSYLQLSYARPIKPSQVNIRLAYTYNAIVSVSIIDILGYPHQIYEEVPSFLDECPSILTIDITDIDEPVYAVRLDLDTLSPDEEGNLTAIDAVEIVGTPLSAPAATPVPTPYLTVSHLGINASQVQEGYVNFEIRDLNTDETLTSTECDGFSYNLTETERTIKFFSCVDSTEIWVYVPLEHEIGALPLNSYPLPPTARLFFDQRIIPAMEGSLWIDQSDGRRITGVLEFTGFDPENSGAYYGAYAVFNQIPLDEKTAQKPGDMIAQWAKDVTASSELSPQDHAALQSLGSSDTWEDCEGAVSAWQPAPTDPNPWIELYFETPVQPEALNILFTGSPESVSAVNLLSETDYFPLDLSNARILEGCPTSLTFNPISEVDMPIIGVQIMFASGHFETQLGLDAIQLIGIISK